MAEELLLAWLREGDDNGDEGGFKRSGVLCQKGFELDNVVFSFLGWCRGPLLLLFFFSYLHEIHFYL